MTQITPDSGRDFRLILREGGVARTMGGDAATLGVQYVDKIITEALAMNASDIHIQPERDRTQIRYRVDGMMINYGRFDKAHTSNVLARIKLAAGMHLDEKRLAQDGRIDMEWRGRRFSARVSVLPCLNGEKVVMRLLDPANVRIELSQLGMPPDMQRAWSQAIETPYGMIVVTGPTGSGKTSTLYASLNKLDRKTRNIVTVEDPIEYEFQDNVTQVQVTEKMTFPRVMRAFLRQDPDVMMVGEMRDPESLKIGIQASLTGHLVLTTLHTNNSVETLGRMVDMGGEPYLIAATVICILAQRLVRTICPQCKEPYTPTEDEILQLGLSMDQAAKQTFWHGKGCSACRETGYKGRVGVFELLMNTRPIKELVTSNASALALQRAARKQGMRTMMEDGLEKALRGITTPAEVIRAVYSIADMELPGGTGEETDFTEALAEEPAGEEPGDGA